MAQPSRSTTQIEAELLAEVQTELRRRGTDPAVRVPAPPTPPTPAAGDAISPLVAGAMLACLVLLAASGIALSMWYSPSPEDAASSLGWLELSPTGALVRAAHWHASNLLVALAVMYLGWLAFSGSFRRPQQWRWWRGGLVLVLALAFSLSGQLLPWDQNAVHGTAIRLGYMAELPGGGALRDALAGGGLGSGALVRFYALHVVVLPALLLLLLRWFWADTRPRGAAWLSLAVGGLTMLMVGAAAVFQAAPLGLTGDPSEPFDAARPEWFALPLYELLKILPPGALHLAGIALPPLLTAALLLALPYAERVAEQPARLKLPLRICLGVAGAALLTLGLLPVVEDAEKQAGWFAQPDLEDNMTLMGKRNDALGNSALLLPAHTHALARDLELLAEELPGLYPKDLPEGDRAKYDELARKLRGQARALRVAADAGAEARARADLRQACADCHKLAGQEDIELDPPLPGAVAAQPPRPLFDAGRLAAAKAVAVPERDLRSTQRMMNRAKFRLRDLLRHAQLTAGTPEGEPEQHYADLLEAVRVFDGQWDKNDGTHPDQAKWKQHMADLDAALAALRGAQTGPAAEARFAAVGKACDACHEAGDWDEPFEWLYQDLLK